MEIFLAEPEVPVISPSQDSFCLPPASMLCVWLNLVICG